MIVNTELTRGYIDQSVESRIIGHSGEVECTAEATVQRVAGWRRAGSFVVGNAGGYDAMGLNHLRGLIQARIIGAAYKLGPEASSSDIYDLASSDEIRLIVSVDTNGAIQENKSYRLDCAYSVRPLLDWETRARMLALQGMGGRHDLVDFVTKHGPFACPVCEDESCDHSSKTFNIAASGADLVVAKGVDTTTLECYPDTAFHVIDEGAGAFRDALLGEQISTSALVRRIKQEKEQL